MAPYNGSGSFTLAESAFVPSTPISSSAMNSDLSDIATNGLSNAVTKDGQTTITGPFKGANGSVGVPMYSFASDTNTGMYRHGSDELGFATGGSLGGYFGSDQKLNLTVALVVPAGSLAVAALANGTANRLYGTDGSGVIHEITPSTGLTLSGSTLTAVAQLPMGYINSCTASNGTDATNDINFSVGVCRDSTNAVNITLPVLAGKQLDANWAVGANAGMRNSAVGIANGTYHLYAVATAAGIVSGTADIYAYAGVAGTNPDSSASIATVITALQAETGGSAYLYARRIASILRESATIVPFTQRGNYFLRNTISADISANNPGSSAVTRTLSIPVGLNLFVDTLLTVTNATAANNTYALLSDLASVDQTPSAALSQVGDVATLAGGQTHASVPVSLWTNTSAQIRSRLSFSDATVSININTRGWTDPRGTNA